MNITIAIIVSSHLHFCEEFLRVHKLNPKCFKVAESFQYLRGYDTNTPIIITHHRIDDRYVEFIEAVRHRFTNIRYMDY